MADVSSIAQALAYSCAGVIYPSGLAQASVTGRQAVIRRGWLLPSDMFTAQSVRNNVDYVTVTSDLRDYRAEAEPLGWPWSPVMVIPPNVTAVAVAGGFQIEVPGGLAPVGIVGARIGGQVCSYAAGPSDTAASIAQGLVAGLPGLTASGAVVSGPVGFEVSVAGYGRAVRVARRQSQRFTVSIFTASASARDVLGAVLDTALATIGWLPTLDGAQALLTFEGAGDVDSLQNQALYRRDLRFSVTFDTQEVQVSGQMLFGGGTLARGPAGQFVSQTFGDVSGSVGQGAQAALAALNAVSVAFGGVNPYPGLGIDQFGTVVAV